MININGLNDVIDDIQWVSLTSLLEPLQLSEDYALE